MHRCEDNREDRTSTFGIPFPPPPCPLQSSAGKVTSENTNTTSAVQLPFDVVPVSFTQQPFQQVQSGAWTQTRLVQVLPSREETTAAARQPAAWAWKVHVCGLIDCLYAESSDGNASSRGAICVLQTYLPLLDERMRSVVTAHMMEPFVFVKLMCTSLGSQFVQELTNTLSVNELVPIMLLMRSCFVELSCSTHNFHTLLIQVWDRICVIYRVLMVNEIRSFELQLTTHSLGWHIVAAIITYTSIGGYGPVINALLGSDETFRTTIKSRFGHKVILCAIEKMEKDRSQPAEHLLNSLASRVANDCVEWACDKHANFVVQRVIVSRKLFNFHVDMTSKFKSNLLYISQQKWGSHIVEKMFVYGNDTTVRIMMQELLIGYENNSKGESALDVLMTDQYGNYVLQTMLRVGMDVFQGTLKGRHHWLFTMLHHIIARRKELLKYTSGRIIIAKAHAAERLLAQMNIVVHSCTPPTGSRSFK